MAGDNSRLIRLDFFRPYGRVGWRVDGKKVAAFESIKNRAVLSLVPLNQGKSLSVFSIPWLPRGWPHSLPAPVDLSDESIIEFFDHMLQVLEFVERNQLDGIKLTDCHTDDISAISKICEAKQIPNIFEDLILKGREIFTLDVRIGLLKLKELVLQKAERPKPTRCSTTRKKRGRRSKPAKDKALEVEYSAGLESGRWDSKAAFAIEKGMDRSTVSKALKRAKESEAVQRQ